MRIIIIGLEKRLHCRIPSKHPIVGWAAEYGADCLNMYHVGKDGKTAIYRIKGKYPKQPVAEFGEKVQVKMLERERKLRGKYGALGKRWTEGIWVGRKWDANESVKL